MRPPLCRRRIIAARGRANHVAHALTMAGDQRMSIGRHLGPMEDGLGTVLTVTSTQRRLTLRLRTKSLHRGSRLFSAKRKSRQATAQLGGGSSGSAAVKGPWKPCDLLHQ